MGCSCKRFVGGTLRFNMAISFLAGLALLIFGCIVEYPVVSWPAIGMVSLGVLSIFASILGCLGSGGVKCLLLIFLILGTFSTIMQTVLVIGIWASYEDVVKRLTPETMRNGWTEKDLRHALDAAKIVLLVFLLFEYLGIIFAIVMRYAKFADGDGDYDKMDELQQEQRTVALGRLRADIEKSSKKAGAAMSSAYDRVRKKMQDKYGQYSHTVDWKSNKTKSIYASRS